VKLEESFEVKAPAEMVWAALIDVERIAPCLPGAEITEAGDDGTYRGNFQVKLGPTTAAYRGTLKLESLDEAARVATMSANGQDKRGQGSAKATIVSTLREQDGVTTVDVDTDFTITGRLASFGRSGMIQDISKRLLREFATCLQASLETEAGEAGEAGEGGGPAGAAQPPSPPGGPAAAPVPGGGPEAAAAGPGAAAPGTQGAHPRPVTPSRPATAPVQGGSLVLSVLRDRLAGLLRRLADRLSPPEGR
jgi:carbon monoxide dehydrogenase subunit G